MATITVRDLDESTRSRLRIRAARNGRSMGVEVRHILEQATSGEEAEHPPLGVELVNPWDGPAGTDRG